MNQQSSSDTKRVDYKKMYEFLVSQFQETRELISEVVQGKTQEVKKSFLNDSFVDSVYQAGKFNDVKLLNIENASLNNRLQYF